MTEPIVIERDGTVSPSYAPIHREGGTYFLISNTSRPLIVRRNGVVFDGNGCALIGNGTGTAINLLCSNSTIRNMYIANWGTSVLGFYANNTISQNCISSSRNGAIIYAENYLIIGNHFDNCDEAIHLEGSSSLISQNQLSSNSFGIMDPSNVTGNIVIENDFQNNQIAISTWAASLKVHHNNFVNNSYNAQIIQSENTPYAGLTRFWDDGSEGNYWNGNSTTLQNVVCSLGPTIVDRYPLSFSLIVREFEFLPICQSTPAPSSPNQQEPDQIEKERAYILNAECILSILVLVLSALAYLALKKEQTAK